MDDPLGGQPIPPHIQTLLRRRGGHGRPLPGPVAETLGNAFAADLSGIRIHTGSEAAAVSRSLQAEAFAYGHDLYFSAGAYAPHTSSGQRLLAHEVAHTLQSGPERSAQPIIGRAADPAERHTDALADAALRSVQDTAHRLSETGSPDGALPPRKPRGPGPIARKLSLRGPEKPRPGELLTDFVTRKFATFTGMDAYSAREDFRFIADFPGQAIRSLWADRYWHRVNVGTPWGQEDLTAMIVRRTEELDEADRLVRLLRPRAKEVVEHSDPGFTLEAGHIPIFVDQPDQGTVKFSINGLITCVGVIMEKIDGPVVRRVSASHFVTPEAVTRERDGSRRLNQDAKDQLDAQLRSMESSPGYLAVKLVRAELDNGSSIAQAESAMELIRDHIGVVRRLGTYRLSDGDNLLYVLDENGGSEIGPAFESIQLPRRSWASSGSRRTGYGSGY